MRKALDLKPLAYGDALGRSLSLYTSALAGFAGWFVLAWTLPMMGLTVLLHLLLDPHGAQAASSGVWEAGPFATYYWLLKVAAIFLGFGVGAAGVYYLAARLYVGASPTFGEIARAVQQRALALIGAATLHVLFLLGITVIMIGLPVLGIIQGAVVEGTTALLLLGLLWVGLVGLYLGCWSLNVPSVMLDDASALESFGRSRFLSRNFRARAFGLLMAVMLIVGAPGIPGLMVAPAALGQHLLSDYPLTGDLMRLAWEGVLLPLFFIPLTVFYFDMRSRKEGYDLAVMARNFGIEEGEMMRYRMNPHEGYRPKAELASSRPKPALRLPRRRA